MFKQWYAQVSDYNITICTIDLACKTFVVIPTPYVNLVLTHGHTIVL